MVEVKYVDIAHPQKAVPNPDIVQQIEDNRQPLPVVVIDGEIKFKGYVDYWSIVEVIDVMDDTRSKTA